jgi:hypothetical protein
VRFLAPIRDVLRYWRSLGLSPFTWGFVPGVATVGLLFALGLWAIPLILLMLAVFGYVTTGSRQRDA